MPSVFSVVTLTSNSMEYLDETIQSVISQKGDFFVDYIVIDNCSTDGTLDLLKKYHTEISNGNFTCNCEGVTFRFFSEKDDGMYDALVKGMRISKGDYFSYINSDDFYLPNAFATVDRAFKQTGSNWITGLPTLYDKHGSIRPSNTPCVYRSRYIRGGIYGEYFPHIQQESTFWKRSMCDLLEYERLASFRYAGDFYIWYVFAEKNQLYTLNAQLAGFRQHDGNKSGNLAAYNLEVKSLDLLRLNMFDYFKIYIYKWFFKLIGNKLMSHSASFIDPER